MRHTIEAADPWWLSCLVENGDLNAGGPGGRLSGCHKELGIQTTKGAQLWISWPFLVHNLRLKLFMSGIVVLRSGSVLTSGKLSECFGKQLAPHFHKSVLVQKFQQINKIRNQKWSPASKLTCYSSWNRKNQKEAWCIKR